MIRSSAILFMAIMVFATAAFALQSIRLSHETAHSDVIATQVELNRSQLKRLHWELDQLEQQKCFVSESLGIYYEYFTVCASWKMAGYSIPTAVTEYP